MKRKLSPSRNDIAPISAPASRYRGVNQRLQDRLKIEGRAADDLQDIGHRGLLLQRLAEIAVRACTSSNRRTFSMAITAWSAKVLSRLICFSLNGRTSVRLITSAPDRLVLAHEGRREHRAVAEPLRHGPAERKLRTSQPCMSWTCTVPAVGNARDR